MKKPTSIEDDDDSDDETDTVPLTNELRKSSLKEAEDATSQAKDLLKTDEDKFKEILTETLAKLNNSPVSLAKTSKKRDISAIVGSMWEGIQKLFHGEPK